MISHWTRTAKFESMNFSLKEKFMGILFPHYYDASILKYRIRPYALYLSFDRNGKSTVCPFIHISARGGVQWLAHEEKRYADLDLVKVVKYEQQ